jgi:hypothetical protein
MLTLLLDATLLLVSFGLDGTTDDSTDDSVAGKPIFLDAANCRFRIS